MEPPLTKNFFWRPAALLLVWIVSLACSLLPGYQNPPATTPDQTTTEAMRPTDAPGSQTGATASPTAGPYTLAISGNYSLTNKYTFGSSLAARAGKAWIGTVYGTIEEVDAQSGTFGRSIALTPEEGNTVQTVPPIIKLAFEGKYLWAFVGFFEDARKPPYLLAIDPESGQIIRQWHLESPEWMQDYERGFASEDFGVSPGRIWIDGHVVDTQTFEIQNVYMPGMPHFAYNGMDWMWMTGENAGACDDLVLVNTDDPTLKWCPVEWPFLSHTQDGIAAIGPGSPMVLAGDRIWIAGTSTEGVGYTLEAYPANMDQAMNATGPLVSVPLLDSPEHIKMLFARNYLWVTYTSGDKAGFLYQLDPQTGATINSLDLVGDQHRATSNYPQDLAAEGDNLWVLTPGQLLQIKLP